MGDFRIVIDAVGGHGQDRDKKDGEDVDFGINTPEAFAREFIGKLERSGVTVTEAKIIHWPKDNYPERGEAEVTDDLVTGRRYGNF